jgi:uncharacterized membrane protein YfcA
MISRVIPSILTGLFLGVISSFLGIGGGPINVPVIILVFGYATKTAVICSLFIILFSQATNLIIAAHSGIISTLDLTMLPAMLLGAIIGSFVGGVVLKKLKSSSVDYLLSATQVIVFCLCVINVLRNW